MRRMTYDEALKYMLELPAGGYGSSLKSTEELLSLMNNPHNDLKFIHVAGTNGKGSTCAMLASVFKTAGYKTGMFTTPYLIRFNEIMQINGEPISDDDFAALVTYTKTMVDVMSHQPSRFVVATAMCMRYFKDNGCDIVILETGVGGIDDPTNVVKNVEAAVITAIDIDHAASLGHNIESITKAKAGIIKPGCDVIFYGCNPIASRVIQDKCCLVGARYHEVDRVNRWDSQFYSSNLIGFHQFFNRALVLKTLEVLRNKYSLLCEVYINEGLKNTKWPGRFETLLADPTFIFDGAHNPHGVKAAVDTVKSRYPFSKIILIMGVMRDKDVESMVDILVRNVDVVHTVTPDHPRAMNAIDLAQVFARRAKRKTYITPQYRIKDAVFNSIKEARKEKDCIVLALGSFHIYKDIVENVKLHTVFLRKE